MNEALCAFCEKPFLPYRVTHRYCSERCKQRGYKIERGLPMSRNRTCRVCGVPFSPIGQAGANRQHCSDECARASARKSRQEFHKRNPHWRESHKYPDKRKNRPTVRKLERLWRKYPDLPRACEGCGEDRVLDVAHRPEFARNGTWPIMGVLQPHMIWVLCPTCHALLDRLGYSAHQLGIRPRLEIAA